MTPVVPRPPGHLLFVYGTLKRGGENQRHLEGQEFLGPARTAAGYRLYHLHGYPGMIAEAGSPNTVAGELWAVDDVCLRELDRLEGVDEGLYERAAVRLAPPLHLHAAETYLYLRSVEGMTELDDEWRV